MSIQPRVLCLPAPTMSPYYTTIAGLLLAAAAVCFAFMFAVPKAHADGLSQSQLQNVQALLLSNNGIGNSASAGMASSTPGCVIPSRSLSRGSDGQDVRDLQERLIQGGYLATSSATGYFGTLTEDAVKQWQADHNVIATGTPATTGYGAVGPKTLGELERSCGDQSHNNNQGEDNGYNAAGMPMYGTASSTGTSTPRGIVPPPVRTPIPGGDGTDGTDGQSSLGAAAAFAADYSAAFNANLAAVVAAPFHLAVDSLTQIFVSLGVGQ